MGEMPRRGYPRYSIGDLVRGIGISRTSLRYHESIDLINPERGTSSNYRSYDDGDYLTVVAYTAMRNLGYGAKDLRGMLEKGDDPFSVEHLREYRAKLVRDIAYKEALSIALKRHEEHQERCRKLSGWELVDIPAFFFSPDGHDRGFDHFVKTPVNELLLRHMPITAFGAVFPCGDDGIEPLGVWGLMVYEDQARMLLEDGQIERMRHLGGRCLAVRVSSMGLRGGMTQEFAADVARALDESGCRLAGSAFLYRWLPSPKSIDKILPWVLYIQVAE